MMFQFWSASEMSSMHPLAPSDFTPFQLRSTYLSATFVSLSILGFGLVTTFGEAMYGLVVIGMAFAPYAFSYPKVGMWLSVSFVMVASLIAPPAGFEYGYGYSPELTYWAIGTCVVFAALLGRYLMSRENSSARNGVPVPSVLWAYAAISVFSAMLGIARHYPFLDVAKQFYGCLLFCAYFLFVLKFMHTEQQIEYVMDRIKNAGLFCAVVYIVVYLSLVPREGLRKELTVLSAYAGGLAVLYLPGIVNGNGIMRRFRLALPMLLFLSVPLLAQFKRAILGFVICGLLASGLRS